MSIFCILWPFLKCRGNCSSCRGSCYRQLYIPCIFSQIPRQHFSPISPTGCRASPTGCRPTPLTPRWCRPWFHSPLCAIPHQKVLHYTTSICIFKIQSDLCTITHHSPSVRQFQHMISTNSTYKTHSKTNIAVSQHTCGHITTTKADLIYSIVLNYAKIISTTFVLQGAKKIPN